MDWYVIRKRGSDDTIVSPKTTSNRLRVWLLLVLVVVLGLAVTGYAWARKEVTLVVDGKTAPVTTFKMTVRGLLDQEQVRLGPKDLVQPVADTKLRDKMQIEVIRAKSVELVADGKTLSLLTQAATVGDLLKEEQVILGQEDIVSPPLDVELLKGTTVAIIRVTREVEEKEITIPFSTTKKPTATLNKGQTKVLVSGQNGLATERWEVVYHDGEEQERRLLERKVVKQPVNRVVAEGIMQSVSRGGEDLRFTRVINMKATAYTYTGQNTASGTPPRPGTAAVDPSVISFGTRLYVDGYGHALACDRGSSIKGDRIDLFFATRAEALAWGVRNTNVYILE
jgi:uncharacterized protein YabE (DUF348 family)